MFVISKLNIRTNIVELINDGEQYDDHESALTDIFKTIDNQTEKAYINKIKNNQQIEVYEVHKGVFYDAKSLKHIYQILKLKDYK